MRYGDGDWKAERNEFNFKRFMSTTCDPIGEPIRNASFVIEYNGDWFLLAGPVIANPVETIAMRGGDGDRRVERGEFKIERSMSTTCGPIGEPS